MKHLKTVPVPATTKEVVEKTTCDICDNEISHGRFEVSEVTVSVREGESYPEGGHGTIWEFDICAPCFKTKLMAWLRSQGAAGKGREWEW